jgi:hypothetical protein
MKIFKSLDFFRTQNLVSKSENSLADYVCAAKAPPPAGQGRCPAASPIILSRQIIA